MKNVAYLYRIASFMHASFIHSSFCLLTPCSGLISIFQLTLYPLVCSITLASWYIMTAVRMARGELMNKIKKKEEKK